METTIDSTRPGAVPVAIDQDRPLSHGTRSRPILGLPIARLVPQDIHSIADYAGAVGLAVASSFARSTRARAAGTSLGVSTIGASLLTDYRLSALKLIPIEVHEILDYAVGFACIAAPFVLGYRRREPLVSVVQIASGAAQVLISLFTDYRGYRGRRSGRSS